MTSQLKTLLDNIKDHKIFVKNDFRLVGGTALSYHINHRLSEDLDFFILKPLPRNDIDSFIDFAINIYGEENVYPIPQSNNQMYEVQKVGADINDIQQDWMINKVKVTFCDTSSNVGVEDIFKNDKYTMYGDIKISSVGAIYMMKSLMFYKRVKIRDYFDLNFLFENNKNYSPLNTLKTIMKYEKAYSNKDSLPLFFTMLELKIKSYDKAIDQPLNTLMKNPPDFKTLSQKIYANLQKEMKILKQ